MNERDYRKYNNQIGYLEPITENEGDEEEYEDDELESSEDSNGTTSEDEVNDDDNEDFEEHENSNVDGLIADKESDDNASDISNILQIDNTSSNDDIANSNGGMNESLSTKEKSNTENKDYIEYNTQTEFTNYDTLDTTVVRLPDEFIEQNPLIINSEIINQDEDETSLIPKLENGTINSITIDSNYGKKSFSKLFHDKMLVFYSNLRNLNWNKGSIFKSNLIFKIRQKMAVKINLPDWILYRLSEKNKARALRFVEYLKSEPREGMYGNKESSNHRIDISKILETVSNKIITKDQRRRLYGWYLEQKERFQTNIQKGRNAFNESQESVVWSSITTFPVQKNKTGAVDSDNQERGEIIIRLIPSTRGNVIRGLDEGVRHMTLGETSLLKVRFDCAYSSFSVNTSIPPRSWIVFKVTLQRINGYGLLSTPYRMTLRAYRNAKKVKELVHAVVQSVVGMVKAKKKKQAILEKV